MAKSNLTKVKQKYSKIRTLFNVGNRKKKNKVYDAIIERALQSQSQRNPTSKTLCKILDICKEVFPYITDHDDLKAIQDSISDYFNRLKYNSYQYESYYLLLPDLFENAKKREVKSMTSASDVIPKTSIEETYTIVIKKDSSNDVIFNLNNISYASIMNSIAAITQIMVSQ